MALTLIHEDIALTELRWWLLVVSSHQSCLYYRVSHRLGPLLFIMFINDVAMQISPESPLSLFADDMTLYRPILSVMDYYVLQCDVTSYPLDDVGIYMDLSKPQ